jgi:opacity protein-like surface antigen
MRGSALIAVLLAGAASARAEEPPAAPQEIGAALGLEAGGRVSPGGFHLVGDYLYQLSEQDWFDSGLSITIGGGAAGCFRDRDDEFLCDEGIARGFAAEGFAGARRFFPGQGAFAPYARAGIGVRLVSFRGDEVTGFAIPLQLGGGIRARVAKGIAVVAGSELRLGVGWFDHELGAEPQIGFALHAGVDFAL